MVETYTAVVELIDHDPDERRPEQVQAELAGYVAEVVRSERGYLVAHLTVPADTLSEAAGVAVIVAQAAAQSPAVSIRVCAGTPPER